MDYFDVTRTVGSRVCVSSCILGEICVQSVCDCNSLSKNQVNQCI
jgi:hypothetical protein